MNDRASAETRAAAVEGQGVNRRDFLKRSTSGLVLGFFLPELGAIGEAQAAGGTTVNSWLQVGTDDSITLTIGASDMGQGSCSGLAQIMCEDLMVDYNRVITIQGGPTLANPAPVGTAINTGGSGVTRNNFWKMRDAGAIAREMLVSAAMASKGDSTRSNYTVSNGVIKHVPSGATFTYGQVAAAAALLTPPLSAPLVPDSEFKSIGKTFDRKDIPLKVDGSAKYGLDIRLPNMVYAVIKHCPTFGGKLASTPAKPSGAIAVIPVSVAPTTGRGAELAGNINAVAVVGTNTWDTWQAAKRLNVSWTLPANAANMTSAKILADAQALKTGGTPYVAGGTNPPGTIYTVEGSAATTAAAIAGAAKVVDATYTLPYVAHACMEVLNCTVDYVAGVKCDIYAPTQSAKNLLTLAVALTGLPASQIKVNTTYLGGGLGRKLELDFISQAIQVGMALGRPVKLTWPREEDFAHDQYRPMALIHAKAGLDSTGRVVGWSYRTVSPSISAGRGGVLLASGDGQGIEGAKELPYDFFERSTEFVTHPSQIPVGYWRSVGASLNTFGVESMIDELAVAAGQDPYAFRRARLTDPRWIAVLDAAASKGNWYSPVPRGSARGIAIGNAFNSIVAQVVEISGVTTSSIKVKHVSIAIDCYLGVNPGSIDAQMVGGVVHGLNAALYGKQTFVNGVAQTKNFNNSRMIKINEMPVVDVSIIPNPSTANRATPIGGVGELGVPTMAPALANAYFKLTGKRVRDLPFFPNATMGD